MLSLKKVSVDPNPFPYLEKKPPEEYIRLALREAQKALEVDEVPVGAILVDLSSGHVVARAHNQRELLKDPTAHAEILAITQAAAHYESWRLTEAALFVTLEPCLMCAGAIVQARIPQVFYAADDPKAGAHRSVFEVLVHPENNHRPEVVAGIRAAESTEMLKDFFRKKRLRSPRDNGQTNGQGAGDAHT